VERMANVFGPSQQGTSILCPVIHSPKGWRIGEIFLVDLSQSLVYNIYIIKKGTAMNDGPLMEFVGVEEVYPDEMNPFEEAELFHMLDEDAGVCHEEDEEEEMMW